jgi:hypothetical protein
VNSLIGVLVVSILLVLVVLGLTLFAISSGYKYKHTVDELDENQQSKSNEEESKH